MTGIEASLRPEGIRSRCQSLNRYAYALNNPTTLTDPLGLSSLNPGNPCSDIGFSDSNAGCQQPGCYLNGGWFPASPDCFGTGWPQPPYGGGGGGGGGGGTRGSDAGPCHGDPTGCGSSGTPWPLIVGASAATLAGIYAEFNNPSSPDTLSPSTGTQAFCQSRVLGALNKVFGTNFNSDYVTGAFQYRGAWNFVITGLQLPAAQFNAISLGRYALNPLQYLIGYGPSLHVTNPEALNPNAVPFSNTNVAGTTSIIFTAHLDSAFAYNPIGALLHYLIDVLNWQSRALCP